MADGEPQVGECADAVPQLADPVGEPSEQRRLRGPDDGQRSAGEEKRECNRCDGEPDGAEQRRELAVAPEEPGREQTEDSGDGENGNAFTAEPGDLSVEEHAGA